MNVRFGLCVVLSMLLGFFTFGFSGSAAAEDMSWKHEGTAPEGRMTVGFRAGLSLLTQEVVDGTDSSVGPALNFQAMYGVNKWINIGAMLTWERHSVDLERPKADLASVNTVTLLPLYAEFRPGHFGKLQPYVGTGIGVNINSTSEADAFKRQNITLSPGNTFAWRVAGGLDYALTQHFLLNTEFAVNRNRGTLETKQGSTVTDRSAFDASSMNILFGVKYIF
ncbi:outer membrane beta-barrel protein [Nitrospira sp. KM1]|uniref:outer membrane beta-barrel protein n=1 Tax=Nitrospira sp. KM1 TaxID=1936990 RepID=UPI001567A009|nr:outer membrane beta-barrel protein [Nitrospira sp. KM1]